MSSKQWVVDNLAESLRLMAAPVAIQLASLPEWVAMPDEIVLMFQDAYLVLDASDVPPGSWPLLDVVVRQISAMEDEPRDALWTPDALERRPEWSHLRQAAEKALLAMGEPLGPPRINAANYVPAREWPRKDS